MADLNNRPPTRVDELECEDGWYLSNKETCRRLEVTVHSLHYWDLHGCHYLGGEKLKRKRIVGGGNSLWNSKEQVERIAERKQAISRGKSCSMTVTVPLKAAARIVGCKEATLWKYESFCPYVGAGRLIVDWEPYGPQRKRNEPRRRRTYRLSQLQELQENREAGKFVFQGVLAERDGDFLVNLTTAAKRSKPHVDRRILKWAVASGELPTEEATLPASSGRAKTKVAVSMRKVNKFAARLGDGQLTSLSAKPAGTPVAETDHVRLYGFNDPVEIDGRRVPPLSLAQRDVILFLMNHGPVASKDLQHACGTRALRTLRKIEARHPLWKQVIRRRKRGRPKQKQIEQTGYQVL